MALGKTINTPKGTACFWVIGSMWRDTFSKAATMQLRGYTSREDCDSNKQYLDKYDYSIPQEVYDNYLSAEILKENGVCDLGKMYDFIKFYDSRFTDAEDLIYMEVV